MEAKFLHLVLSPWYENVRVQVLCVSSLFFLFLSLSLWGPVLSPWHRNVRDQFLGV